MLFAQERNLYIFLRGKGLIVFDRNSQKSFSLSFPPEAVQNLEVTDQEKLNGAVGRFLAENKLTSARSVLVLSDEVLFTKSIAVSDEAQKQAEIDKFLEEVPLEVGSVTKEIIPEEGEIFVVATNRKFYQGVMGAFAKAGWEILAVVPITIFNEDVRGQLASGKVVNQLVLGQMLASEELLARANLLEGEKTSGGTQSKSSFLRSFDRPLLVVGLLVALLLVVGLLIAGLLSASKGVRTKKVRPSLTVTSSGERVGSSSALKSETGTSSVSGKITDRRQVRIEVLNGSGAVGQAALVKDELARLGYERVDAGNASKSGVTRTTVAVGREVTPDLVSEIVTKLEEMFENVASSSGSIGSNYDLVITTGKAR